jgi:potassium-dependent mechanosensitive channel
MRIWIFAVLLALTSLFAPAGGFAQTNGEASAQQQTGPDYEAWRSFATQAEAVLDARGVTNDELGKLRTDLVAFRARFLAAQDANTTRIASVRDQIAALGPVPEDPATEATEIAARRAELAEQLTALQAPAIAAQEAFRRADGLIRQIDTTLRERDAEALLTLWPSPVNPVNWVAAVDAIWGTTFTFATQIIGAADDPARMREFKSNLPISLILILFSGFVLIKGRGWIERIVGRLLDDGNSRASRRLLARLMSLAQILVPVTAIIALSIALDLTSLFGDIGSALTVGLTAGGAAYFVARWAGRQVFPLVDAAYLPLHLTDARRREGRFWSNMIGVAIAALEILRAYLPVENLTDAANAVVTFPLIAFSGLVLFRLGMLLRLNNRHLEHAPKDNRFLDRMVAVLGNAAMAIGIGAPIFAAIGYVQAAEALVFPAIGTLGLIVGLLFVMQLVEDIYALVTKARVIEGEAALIPSLINFGLVILSLPLFALVWGIRPTELLEIWQVLREGFRLGETRISPTNILSFVVVFSIGYMITRVLQGALGTSVLPKTKIDKGGQKAVISGTGYVGIFASALIAISTAGIDLSGLAIVAGALSVGIGFGLQNIVSNFISGVILLIERPVAEGDWIEVGGTMGTVRSISVRSTVIETFDRTDVIVPNADLISGTVTNWTRYNSLGRITIQVGVAYGSDTRRVEALLQEIGNAQPLAVRTPRPIVLFTDFGADALMFELRVVLSDVTLANAVRTEIRHQIAERFREEGIEIPFAQRDIWLRNPEMLHPGAPVAATKPVPPRQGPNPAPQAGEFSDVFGDGDGMPQPTQPES